MLAQHISVRASGRRSVVEAAAACCGVNSQDLRESFASFWARTEGFEADAMQREFRPMGGLARAWTARGTMHTFPSKDYFAHVFGSPRKRVLGRYERSARRRGIPHLGKRVESLYGPLLDDIKGRAVTSAYIGDFVSERLGRLGLNPRARLRRGWSSSPVVGPAWTGITEMSYLGLLVNAGRRGSESIWMRAADWVHMGRSRPPPEECVNRLVRMYVERYGPVTRADISYWSGLLSSEVGAALAAMKGELTEAGAGGPRGTHYSLGEPPRDADPPAAAVLPEFDSLMMGYRDKARVLPDRLLAYVFRPQGMVSPTFLVDGFVAGTWRRWSERGGTVVTVMPGADLSSGARRAVEGEFAEYGEFLGVPLRVTFSSPVRA
jgi:hypothetical protein